MRGNHLGGIVAGMLVLAPLVGSVGPISDLGRLGGAAPDLGDYEKLPGSGTPLVALDEEGLLPPERGPDVPGVKSSPYADKDRNRIFDTLDREMLGKPDGWRREVVVLLLEEPTPQKMAELKEALGGFVVTSYKENPWDAEGKPWTIVPGFAAELTKAQILALAKRTDTWQIEPVIEFHALMNTAKDESGVDKAKTDFGVNGDRTGAVKTYTKDDIVVCVIDTGIYGGHSDLNEGQVIAWKDFVNGRTSAYDDNGHGTHVAGIAAGQGDANSAYRGVAHGAGLVGVKVLDAAGSGSLTNVVNGINWCKDNKATHGIEIINLSLGAGTCTSGTDSTSNAANAAVDAGLVVMVAAGNSGPGYCTVGDPGAASKVITVGAVSDPDNAACGSNLGRGWYLARFSSRGKTSDGRFKPEIAAPGVCITSVGTSSSTAYTTLSGTSMATPFMAGVAALMLDANTGLTPADVKSNLMSSSRDFGPDNQLSEPQSYDWGAGIVDAHTAVEQVCGCGTFNAPGNPAHFHSTEDLAGTGKVDIYNLDVTSTVRSISITLIVPSASATKDFDLRLVSPGGATVASSLGTDRQETISYVPGSTGTYKVRVNSYTGSGTYWLDVTASAASMTLSQDQ